MPKNTPSNSKKLFEIDHMLGHKTNLKKMSKNENSVYPIRSFILKVKSISNIPKNNKFMEFKQLITK